MKDVLVVSHASRSGPLLKKLVAVLNSKAMRFYYNTSFPTLHVQRDELASLPVCPSRLNDSGNSRIPALVDLILAAKKADPAADTTKLEREIDEIVYRLFDLTPDEIAHIEQSLAGVRAAGKDGDGLDEEAD